MQCAILQSKGIIQTPSGVGNNLSITQYVSEKSGCPNGYIGIPLMTVGKINSTSEHNKDEQNLVFWYHPVADLM